PPLLSTFPSTTLFRSVAGHQRLGGIQCRPDHIGVIAADERIESKIDVADAIIVEEVPGIGAGACRRSRSGCGATASPAAHDGQRDRKSTRLNSSHGSI